MSNIYIASYDVALQFQHLYLVFENDLGEQFVIRGGPEADPQFSITDPNFSFGNILIEANIELSESEDRFTSDRTGDGLPDTPSERNFTELDLGGRDAEDIWQEFINFSQSLAVEPGAGVANTFITNTLYSFSTANSNSFINSVLASAGIDLADQTPRDGGDEAGGDRFTLSTFPAATTFLSGSGDNEFAGGDNAVSHLFIDTADAGNSGADTFYGGELGRQVLNDLSDGTDTYVAINPPNSENLTVSFITDAAGNTIGKSVEDAAGNVDQLFSIENVVAGDVSSPNSIDFQNLNGNLIIRETQTTELAGELNSLSETPFIDFAVSATLSGTDFGTFANFSNFTGTNFFDQFFFNDVGRGLTINGGGGNGSDRIDYSGFESVNNTGVRVDLDLGVAQENILVAGPGAPVGSDMLLNIEQAIGSRFDDVLIGSDEDDFLGGGADGDDQIFGGGGDDTLIGGANDNWINFKRLTPARDVA